MLNIQTCIIIHTHTCLIGLLESHAKNPNIPSAIFSAVQNLRNAHEGARGVNPFCRFFNCKTEYRTQGGDRQERARGREGGIYPFFEVFRELSKEEKKS